MCCSIHVYIAASVRLSENLCGVQRNRAWCRGSCSCQRTVGRIDFSVQGRMKEDSIRWVKVIQSASDLSWHLSSLFLLERGTLLGGTSQERKVAVLVPKIEYFGSLSISSFTSIFIDDYLPFSRKKVREVNLRKH